MSCKFLISGNFTKCLLRYPGNTYITNCATQNRSNFSNKTVFPRHPANSRLTSLINVLGFNTTDRLYATVQYLEFAIFARTIFRLKKTEAYEYIIVLIVIISSDFKL